LQALKIAHGGDGQTEKQKQIRIKVKKNKLKQIILQVIKNFQKVALQYDFEI